MAVAHHRTARKAQPSVLGTVAGLGLTLLAAAGLLGALENAGRPASARPAVVTAPPPGDEVRTVRGRGGGVVPDPRWVRTTAAAAAVPRRTLTAYANATLRVAGENPGCGLTWTTLAGIGSVETAHGTFGGTRVRGDGTTAAPILGPALDGEGGFAAIPATPASTALHGDPDWDHAMGPMQFIPSTWESWGADGDGDGAANPHDVDDAALAAGRYLCASGGDLTSTEGWTAAVLAYNRSGEYVREVAARADAAARGVAPR